MRWALDIMGIPHLDNPSHIIPVMVGDAKKCKIISDWLTKALSEIWSDWELARMGQAA